MGQSSYSIDHDAAIAGQVVEGYHGSRRVLGRFEASESLNFGRIVELHTDGELRQPQTAAAAGKLMGGVPYNPALPPGGYSTTNDLGPVPVVRKGQMWIEYAGTAPTVGTAAKVCSSSTTATNRGKVTGDSTSTSTGAEIYTMSGTMILKVDTSLSLALVEFNLPA